MNATRGRRYSEASREGKSPISFWIRSDKALRLKQLALAQNTTVNALMETAVEMVFNSFDAMPTSPPEPA